MLGVVVLMPLAVLTLTPNLMLQNGYLDPYMYTGFIHGFRELTTYFGPTYYGNRIAAIDPSRAAVDVFGSDRGYFVVRYLLIASAVASVYAIGHRFYGGLTGIFSALILCFSPWYLRSVAWDYVDGFAITYLLVGLAFLLVPRRLIIVPHVLAGFFFALAVNTNLFVLAVGGLFAPSWIILNRRRGAGEILLGGCALVIGFAVAYILLGEMMRTDSPSRPFLFDILAIDVAKDLITSGGSASFFVPLSQFMAQRHDYVVEPLALAAAITVLAIHAMRRTSTIRSRDYVVAATAYVMGIVALYLVSHFVLHHGRITLFYYFSYTVIPNILVIVALLGEILSNVPRRVALAAGAIASAGYVLMFVTYSPTFSTTDGPLWLWRVVTAALPVSLIVIADRLWKLRILVAALVVLPVPFYHSSDDYARLHSSEKAQQEWDVYHSALYLERTLNRVLVPQQGAIKFWYNSIHRGPSSDPREYPSLDSVQSLYLWGYSRVPNMPVIDDGFWSRVKEARYLVVLAASDEEVDRALQSLSRVGIGYKTLHHDHFDSRTWSIRFAAVELPPNLPAPKT